MSASSASSAVATVHPIPESIKQKGLALGHADKWDGKEELFMTVTEADNQPTGLVVPRSVVHRLGLHHRSVHVLVMNKDNKLLIQKRSDHKDVCPSCWDLSVGEHLQPAEDPAEGAARGLAEELMIAVSASQLTSVLSWHENIVKIDALGVYDREWQQTFALRYDGQVAIGDGEVQAWKWIDVAELRDWMEKEPSSFTTWFFNEMKLLPKDLSSMFPSD